jgi:hypothetical protein
MSDKNQKPLDIPSDNVDRALAELIRQGRVEVVKDSEGRDVYRIVKN